MNHPLLDTTEGRQRLLAAALHIARGTALEPRAAERMLLAHFVSGALTLDELQARLEHPNGPAGPANE